MTWWEIAAGGGLYVILGRASLGARTAWGKAAFGAINLAALFFFLGAGRAAPGHFIDDRFAALFLVSNLVVLALQYAALRASGGKSGAALWIAFALPILFLAALRYLPVDDLVRAIPAVGARLVRNPEMKLSAHFVGFSYIAFRTSYLVFEVRNRTVKLPGFIEYASFALFLPTLSVGPISSFRLYDEGYERTAVGIPVGKSLVRVVMGAVKYKFFGSLLYPLTYTGLLLDGHPHPWIDLPVAIVAYYLYLFCNFSGFCDIAIGAAGLMGIPVAENFDRPFIARNMREFWNRWHITLSHYMRDVLFTPVSKSLLRLWGNGAANAVVGVTTLLVFLLLGIWHGVGLHYAIFGLIHAFGVAGNYYYAVLLKRKLGKARLAAYNRNRLIHWAAVALTFVFVAFALFVFANTGDQTRQILAALRAG